MNKLLYTALLLLVISALLFWSYRSGVIFTDNKKLVKPPVVAVPVPAREASVPNAAEKNVLNLALPKNPMLVDPLIKLPNEQHDLKNIFDKTDEEPVSLDARLLIDENPEPNAGVWDAVKGAEVGITIKTP